MNRSMLIGVVMGVGGAIAGGALASYAVWSKEKQAQPQAAAQVPASFKQPETAKLFEASQSVATPVVPAVAVPAAPKFAVVTRVEPVRTSISTPKEVCHDEQVVHKKEVVDEHRVTGTLLGGVVGGAIGNQIGKGRGRDVARVAGAIAGGYAGNRVQKNMQDGDTYTTTERRCTTENQTSKKTIGYDVTYRWNGALKTVRMKQRPGDRLPVQNGEVILVSAKNLAKYD